MNKMKCGTLFLSTLLVLSTEVNAYSLDLVSNKREISAGDKIVLNVKLQDLESEIDTYQAKLIYNANEFNTVTERNFALKNDWNGLAFNPENGIFVIEKDNKTKEDIDVLTITLESKSKLDVDKLNISLTDNLVSGGASDMETADINIDVDVIKGGYIIDGTYIREVKPKTPIANFKTILVDGKDASVKVFENGTEITQGEVKTGMTVEVTENNNVKTYTMCVIGDVNGDGQANSIDSKLIKAYRNEIISLEEEYVKAADINNDNKVNVYDTKLLLYHRADVEGYNFNYSK